MAVISATGAASATTGTPAAPQPALGRPGRGWLAAVALPALLGLAWALRLYRSGRQSLNADEIATLQASQVPDLTAFLQSHAGLDHPPLHFLFERLWTGLAGTSEFALRFPSAVAGVVAVALLYQAGRLLGGARVGAVAALLCTISSFMVYFGQEARGYTFMLVGLTSCLYLAARLTRGASDRWWIAWGATAGLTALTMYIAIPALATMALYLTWLARTQRRWGAWRGCVLAGGALFGAWALYANPLSGVYDTAGDLTPRANAVAVLTRGMGAPVAGAFLPEPWAQLAAVPFLLLVLLGAARSTTGGRWLLGGSVVVSLAIVTLAAVDRLGFHPRYVLPALPAAYLLAAGGLVQLERRGRLAAAVLGLLVIAPMTLALANTYFQPAYSRTDFKSAAAFLMRRFRTGDVVIYNAPWGKTPFEYYAGRALTSVGLRADTPEHAQAAMQRLEALVAGHQRIWLVRWQDWFTDPQRSMRARLDGRLPKIFERQFPFITVEGYLARAPVERAPEAAARPFMADFAGRARLATVTVDATGVAEQGRMTVSTEWLSLGPTDRPYKVFVHLVDGNGTLLAQRDREPVFGLLPTTRWQADTLVRDDYDIVLPDHVAEGPYHVRLGLYLESGGRLQVTGAGADYARVPGELWLKR